ncbi:PKD domain-containing protein [Methanospirillum stamsii]|uniref:PKD domain-containing protein n=1 Tax=Methanospirillum stamsii TaxID=1277351 RepID=A0A2V2NKH2_9EURY|nr:PKD domain-containing protein [Methanospirillum stamsii]PWR76111.1 hypothetical protein DLD82_01035 [Methanospirillum stamsii]
MRKFFPIFVAICLILTNIAPVLACSGGTGYSDMGTSNSDNGATTPAASSSSQISAKIKLSPSWVGQAPLEVKFSSTILEGSPSSIIWDFGDGSSGEGSEVEHTYTKAGPYTVVVTITDTSGETFTKKERVVVSESPSSQEEAPSTNSDSTEMEDELSSSEKDTFSDDNNNPIDESESSSSQEETPSANSDFAEMENELSSSEEDIYSDDYSNPIDNWLEGRGDPNAMSLSKLTYTTRDGESFQFAPPTFGGEPIYFALESYPVLATVVDDQGVVYTYKLSWDGKRTKEYPPMDINTQSKDVNEQQPEILQDEEAVEGGIKTVNDKHTTFDEKSNADDNKPPVENNECDENCQKNDKKIEDLKKIRDILEKMKGELTNEQKKWIRESLINIITFGQSAVIGKYGGEVGQVLYDLEATTIETVTPLYPEKAKDSFWSIQTIDNIAAVGMGAGAMLFFTPLAPIGAAMMTVSSVWTLEHASADGIKLLKDKAELNKAINKVDNEIAQTRNLVKTKAFDKNAQNNSQRNDLVNQSIDYYLEEIRHADRNLTQIKDLIGNSTDIAERADLENHERIMKVYKSIIESQLLGFYGFISYVQSEYSFFEGDLPNAGELIQESIQKNNEAIVSLDSAKEQWKKIDPNWDFLKSDEYEEILSDIVYYQDGYQDADILYKSMNNYYYAMKDLILEDNISFDENYSKFRDGIISLNDSPVFGEFAKNIIDDFEQISVVNGT